VPNQHGAWAFLAVPLLLGLALVGVTPIGLAFAAAWLLAYPATYYLGRAVVIRWRRGTWTRLARREWSHAVPWVAAAGSVSLLLVVLRPWLMAVGGALAAAWAASLWLTRTGHERGVTNDLLLVGQAALAVPLLWAVTIDAWPPADSWWAAGVCAVFFTGSVLHVKSLIREADDHRWALGSRAFNVAALGMGLLSPWLLIPFGAAAVRAFAVRPGTRPGVIGAVEAVVSVLVVIAGALALG
jgi:hypothetical protein